MPLDQRRLDAFAGRFIGDLGTLMHAATVLLGDELGLYQALADGIPATVDDLATRVGIDRRYIEEWLAAQAAAGYVDYDADSETFTLPEEHAAVLTRSGAPLFIPGAFRLARSVYADQPKIAAAWRQGRGFGWHEHHHDLFVGTEEFFRPGYAANLVSSWIPALDGVHQRLSAGGRVADVGCGLGASTILMAEAYPKSTFLGTDLHDGSIAQAKTAAEKAGVSGRVSFEVAPAAAFPGSDYDLVTMFDCLHDMGDPAGAARHVRDTLGSEGTWMVVEPMAGERLADNINPLGKIFYAAGCTICVPASRAQEVGLGLGPQAAEGRFREISKDAGFTRFRRAAETPTNRIFEVRP